jgi:hypothetical protein
MDCQENRPAKPEQVEAQGRNEPIPQPTDNRPGIWEGYSLETLTLLLDG